MNEAIQVILVALGGGTIAIAFVIYYVLFHPEKAEKVAGWFAALVGKVFRKADPDGSRAEGAGRYQRRTSGDAEGWS